jgi:hypothetical protein
MDNVWFSETVHAEFQFLTSEHGFSSPRVTCADGTLEPFPPKPDPSCHYASVIYERGNQFVKCTHGSHGVEFDLILGFCRFEGAGESNVRQAYLESLLGIVAPEHRFPPIHRFATLEQKFSYAIQVTAQALRLHGKRFFEDDPNLWNEIQDQTRLKAAQFLLEAKNQQLRRDAQSAFENSQWKNVIECYRAVTDRLSASETKRLYIAEKRLADHRPATE